MHNIKCFIKKLVTFVYNFVLRKFGFRGQFSAPSKNRGRSKKTHGWGSYLQRGSAPPPGPKFENVISSCLRLWKSVGVPDTLGMES